jgi:hypothetical protein
MVEPLRHRQTKEAATDMCDLQPPRHISTPPFGDMAAVSGMSVSQRQGPEHLACYNDIRRNERMASAFKEKDARDDYEILHPSQHPHSGQAE